jgi:17beta-estradiol 17-dehydrogenase / very-long-chain 3-oxoacyl-CoA reductase
MASLLAFLIGGALLYALYTIADFLTLHFYHPSQPLAAYKRKGTEPTYALITGSSAGIGLGLAQELVAQGFGVILLGHLPDELNEAKSTLERRTPGAAVRTVTMNAITATPEDLDTLALSLRPLRLSILINNVGGCPYHLPMRELSTMSCADIDRTINMNARFMSRLTALLLPQLTLPPSPGERSLIVNLSSSSHIGLPWLTIYSATKAYNLAFSAALSRELITHPATRHVDCIAITPGDVQSQSNTQAAVTNSPTWESYGRCVVRTLDNAVMRGLKVFVPYWFHDLSMRVVPWLSESVRQSTFTKVIGAKKAAWEAEATKTK